MKHCAVIPFTIFFLLATGLFAQQPPYTLIGTDAGLSQGFVRCLLKDREGFLWAGTQNGLNRYDGRRFKVFKHDVFDTLSLSGNFVVSLHERGDYLLVGTLHKGLNLFDKRTHRFYRLPFRERTPEAYPSPVDSASMLMSAAVMRVRTDAKGDIWVFTRWDGGGGETFTRIALPNGFWSKLREQPELVHQLQFYHWHQPLDEFALTSDGHRVYHHIHGRWHRFDDATNQWTPLNIPEPHAHTRERLLAFSGGLLLNTRSGNQLLFSENGSSWHPLPTAKGTTILHQAGKFLWGLQNDQLVGYSFSHPHAEKPRLAHELTLDKAGDLMVVEADATGNVWRGWDANGFRHYITHLNRFQHVFAGHSVVAPPLLTPQGNTWLINFRGHILPLNPPTGKEANLLRFAQSWFTHSLRYDRHGHIWGLMTRNPEGSVLLHWDVPAGTWTTHPLPVTVRHPTDITLDARGQVYFASRASLHRFNPSDGSCTSWSFAHLGLQDRRHQSIAQTADGALWMGISSGLIHAVPEADSFRFEYLRASHDQPDGLTSDNIACLTPSPTDPHSLWIGTRGGGLNRYNTRTRSFGHFGPREGLPDDFVYAVMPDSAGHLWLSTNKGLVRFHPDTRELRHYQKQDGLQDNEFNSWAFGTKPDGTLVFGGVNGLTIFQPSAIRDNPEQPPVYITDIHLNNRPATVQGAKKLLDEAIEYAEQVSLPYALNTVTLQFAALEWTLPCKNRFRYYLEGMEPEWAHEDSEGSATYLNLPPGAYTFLVKGANHDGIWSEEVRRLGIVIEPPWYRSFWTYALYALLGFALLFGLVRFRLNTLQLQRSVQERARMRAEEQMKRNFFANITHEFRTPLTVMLGLAERMGDYHREGRSDRIEQGAGLIIRNGRHLLSLVNQMLDLAKLESNMLTFHPEPGDLVAFARSAFASFEETARTKGVVLRCACPQESLWTAFDADKVFSVVSNLIHNAIKFTPPGGTVTLRVTDQGHQALIEVEDTGAGIAESDMPHIFDRFFRASTNTEPGTSTGLGLAVSKELLQFMGGQIQVQSTPGVGSLFQVKLPILTRPATTPSSPFEAKEQPDYQEHNRPIILLVDDHPDIIQYILFCLGDTYDVLTAHDGPSGLEQALKHIPDIVLSDVMMPGMPGTDLLRALRADDRTSHIPVVVLTARADKPSRLEGLDAGADAYLTKPFDLQELKMVLHNLLDMRQRLRKTPTAGEHTTPSPNDPFLERLLLLIREHMADPDYNAVELSKAVHMSPSQLLRKVRALTGLSTTLYIRRCRLEYAYERLQACSCTIAEISYAAGFNDPAYFTRVFTDAFGVTPSSVRR